MKTFSAIFDLFAIALMIMICSFYFNMSKLADNEFYQERYEYACRQATEAMFRSTLSAEDLDLDYTDLTYAVINASSAMDVFDRVMAYNYNMSICEENFSAINESLVCCVIAGYDGYYVASYYEEDTLPNNGTAVDGYGLKFSAKIPYTIEVDNKIYALDIAKHTYSYMSTNNPTYNPKISPTVGQSLPGGITDEDIELQLNTQIRNSILEELTSSQNVSMMDYSQFKIYFPFEQTATGVNPFEVPGIFVFMQGASYSNTENMKSVAVSGYKMTTTRHIILFTDPVTKIHYYAYQGQLNDEELNYFTVDDYVDKLAEAVEKVATEYGYASNGYDHYSPYYEVLQRKAVTSN